MVNKIAQYRVFSTIDLRSAYHQVLLKEEDKPYTAFEARGNLYQFTRLSFGVTNGVACFQREMMKFVDENGLEASFPYLDNVTICGKDQEDHDANLKQFLEAAKRKNLCYNSEKCIFSTRCLPIFGYIIEEGTIRPDPDRLRPKVHEQVSQIILLLFTMDPKVLGSNQANCLLQDIPFAPTSC